MSKQTTKPHENHSISQLIILAVQEMRIDSDSDSAWEIIRELRSRTMDEIFDRAINLSDSLDAVERELGADLLVLGCFESTGTASTKDDKTTRKWIYPKAEASRPIIEKLLTDKNDNVVAAAIYSSVHLGFAKKLINPRVDFATHKSASIRQAMSFAINLSGSPSQSAVEMVILLMRDDDEEIRDWATFTLGSQSDVDTEQVRDALFVRLQDTDETVQMEAALGLARRGDERVVQVISQYLNTAIEKPDSYEIKWIDAAADIASPLLVDPLLKLKTAIFADDDEDLDLAIRRCQGEVEPDGRTYGLGDNEF